MDRFTAFNTPGYSKRDLSRLNAEFERRLQKTASLAGDPHFDAFVQMLAAHVLIDFDANNPNPRHTSAPRGRGRRHG